MSGPRQIVAIGLLTEQDLEMLGQGFDRAFPVEEDLVFEDLLRAIDEADRQLNLECEARRPA